MCKYCEPEELGGAMEALILNDVMTKEFYSKKELSLVNVNTAITVENGQFLLSSMVVMGGEVVSVESIPIAYCPRCGRQVDM